MVLLLFSHVNALQEAMIKSTSGNNYICHSCRIVDFLTLSGTASCNSPRGQQTREVQFCVDCGFLSSSGVLMVDGNTIDNTGKTQAALPGPQC